MTPLWLAALGLAPVALMGMRRRNEMEDISLRPTADECETWCEGADMMEDYAERLETAARSSRWKSLEDERWKLARECRGVAAWLRSLAALHAPPGEELTETASEAAKENDDGVPA